MKSSTKLLGFLIIGGVVASSLINKAKTAVPAPKPLQGMDGLGCPNTEPNALYGDDVANMLHHICGTGDSYGPWLDQDAPDRGLEMDGLGRFSFKKAISKVVAPIQKLTAPVTKELKKVTAPITKQLSKDLKMVEKVAIKQPLQALKKGTQLLKTGTQFLKSGLTFQPLRKKSGGGGSDASAPTEYQDANGNIITADQYNALVAAQAAADAAYTGYADADGNPISADQYNALVAAQNAAPADTGYIDADGNPISADQYNALVAQANQDNIDMNNAPTTVPDQYSAMTSDTQPADQGSALDEIAAEDAALNVDDGSGGDGSYADNGVDPTMSQSMYDYNNDPTVADPNTAITIAAPSRYADVAPNSNTGWDPNTDTAADSQATYDRGQQGNGYNGDQFAAYHATTEDIIGPSSDEPAPYSADEANQFSDQPEETFVAEEYGNAYQDYDESGEPMFDPYYNRQGQPSGYNGNTIAYFDGSAAPMSGLGFLTSRASGRPLVVATHKHVQGRSPIVNRRPYVQVKPIMADKVGNLFHYDGAQLKGLGHVDDLAGQAGLGFSLFGRSWGTIAKTVIKREKAAHNLFDPVAVAYKWTTKHPKYYAKWRRNEKIVTPYVAIAGAAVATVYTGGAAAPTIAVAVADLAAQGAKDYEKNVAARKARAAQEGYDAEQEALNSTQDPNNRGSLPISNGPATGEMTGGDQPNQYGGDGVDADFLNLENAFA